VIPLNWASVAADDDEREVFAPCDGPLFPCRREVTRVPVPVERGWFGTLALLVAAGAVACMATACASVPDGGETPDLTVREAWPSNGATAHHAMLLSIRVDGRDVFRRFAPLSATRTLFSLDDTGRYQIRGTLYQCAGGCEHPLLGTYHARPVATCSVKTAFDGSEARAYAVTVSDDLSRCRVASEA
jgi:hypothetical protein